MSLKNSFSNLLNYCLKNETAFALWRFPNSNKITAILSDTYQEEKNCDLTKDQGFCISKFDNKGNYTLLQPKVELTIDLSTKNIDVTKNDHSLISDSNLEYLIEINSKFDIDTDPSDLPLEQSLEENYIDIVQSSIGEIQQGTFDKVVLSKFKEEKICNEEIPYLFKQLFSDYPAAFCYLAYIPTSGIWIGATPETLLSYDNTSKIFKTVALAGTQSAKGIELKEAVWRQKEIEEQALVSRYIMNCFKKIRLREFSEKGPKTIKAGSLLHLCTEYIVYNNITRREDLPQTMLELLHPTSAVCGMPLEASKAFINDKENYDREFYTGFLGPVNMNSGTHLYVNLRCGKIYGGKIRLYAGAGITEDSDPSKEWIETEMKCQTILKKLEETRQENKHASHS